MPMHFLEYILTPPPVPDLDLPAGAGLIPGLKTAIAEAFKLVYFRGVWDGAVGMTLFWLAVMPRKSK